MQLHSRYNPQAEAERYINSLNLKDDIECFILIEPGEGYIIPVLRKKFKDSKIIVLHVDNSCTDNFPSTDVPVLRGTDSSAIQKFLEKEVPETGASLIRIIEWRPSLNYFKEAYVKLLSQVVEFVKRTDAGKRTTEAFGTRWVRNFFKNLKLPDKTLLYKTAQIPVIVTGSGPGLETAIPVIQELQDKCLILASSSSVMALAHNGIKADLTIATDGGCWALRHMYPCLRAGPTACAVNLSAALPSQCAGTPHLIINDGSFWQSIILHALSLPSVIIPQKGTVTASAVELAFVLSSGSIYLAGMDLGVKDIRSHAKPYAFDALFYERASRFTPFYSRSFIRSSLIRGGGSMDIYASWFKNALSSWPKRIFSLTPHEIFESAVPRETAVKNTDDFLKAREVKDDPALFSQKGATALLVALKDSRYSEDLKNELTLLLFPEKKEASHAELEKAITEAAHGY
jgi:hypothetical protein